MPPIDWVLAIIAGFCGAYLFLFYKELATRPGIPTTMDITVAAIGLVLLLEVTRRALGAPMHAGRSEEHTSELQSLMRISYAVFCLKKKTNKKREGHTRT